MLTLCCAWDAFAVASFESAPEAFRARPVPPGVKETSYEDGEASVSVGRQLKQTRERPSKRIETRRVDMLRKQDLTEDQLLISTHVPGRKDF